MITYEALSAFATVGLLLIALISLLVGREKLRGRPSKLTFAGIERSS